jgi:anti-sigma factor RsiW
MTCREFDGQMGQYADRELSATRRRDCEAHLAECSSCSHSLQSYRVTIHAAKIAYSEPEPLPDHLLERLIDRMAVELRDTNQGCGERLHSTCAT